MGINAPRFEGVEVIGAPRARIDLRQGSQKVLQLIEQLEIPELCFEKRLDITLQLRELFGAVQEL